MAFALHITWTTYGTWLPGDERGHVSNVLHPGGGFDRKQNTLDTAYAAGDAYTRERVRQLMTQDAVWLTAAQALYGAQSLVEAVVKRNWNIRRAAVMSNHTHVLVVDCPDDGPAVRRVLKGVSQAALSKLVGCNQVWWTAGGSDRRKYNQLAIDTADNYIANQIGKLAEIIDNVVRSCVETPGGINPPAP